MSKIVILLVLCAAATSLAKSVPFEIRTISGAEKLLNPDIAKCIRDKSCIYTTESNPLCGSDDKTYPNKSSLDCLNGCLKPEERITISKPGYCDKDIIRF